MAARRACRMKSLDEDLERRRREHLYRRRRVISESAGGRALVDGRPMRVFCSNDYLGLAGHPEVVGAMQRAAEVYGAGSGSAHLVSGHTKAHQALEEELADFVQRPRALLFSTGYMANIGVVNALVGRGDTVCEDRLNHASLLDAGLLCRARLKRYAHASMPALQDALASRGGGEVMVLSDGVFSMDGDVAPVPELARLAAAHEAWLMVDDAHGLGVLGATGRGSLEHYGLGIDEVPLLVGTLGKALGTFGAFVAGSEALIETLIQRARSYIYTTAPPPAVAEATRASLRLAHRETWRRERLRELVGRFRSAADQLGSPLA